MVSPEKLYLKLPELVVFQRMAKALAPKFWDMVDSVYDDDGIRNDARGVGIESPIYQDSIAIQKFVMESGLSAVAPDFAWLGDAIDTIIYSTDSNIFGRTFDEVWEFLAHPEDTLSDLMRDAFGEWGELFCSELLSLATEDQIEAFIWRNPRSPCAKLTKKHWQALAIIQAEGPIKAIALARKLKIKDGHLRSRIIPALKRSHGIVNSRQKGGYIMPERTPNVAP